MAILAITAPAFPPIYAIMGRMDHIMIRPGVWKRIFEEGRQVVVYLAAYLVALLTMAGLDYVWLTNTSASLYRHDLGALLADDPKMGVAVIFYLLYAAGIVIFAVRPALTAADWRMAALYGALFGLFAYATYDLTNFATLKVWTLRVTVLDIGWGAVVTAAAASAGALAALRVN